MVADDAVNGLIRSVIQHHGAAAAYVFAGSQPSLMHALFSEHERPFYGQARPLDLPPLPVTEAARDIEDLLTAERLDPGDAIDRLLAYTGGHPQRTILLAHHLYNVLEQGPDDRDPTAVALELAIEETRDAHQALWDGLGRNERLILLAIGDGQAPTGSTLRTSTAWPARRCERHRSGCSPISVTCVAIRKEGYTCSTLSSPNGSGVAKSTI